MRNNFRVVRGAEAEVTAPIAHPQPTQRPQQVRRFGTSNAPVAAPQSAEAEYDYLDIPAFLRRQAD